MTTCTLRAVRILFATLLADCVFTVCAETPELLKMLETDSFVLYSAEADRHVLDDILAALEAWRPRIDAHLRSTYPGKIVVEVYPDQAGLDAGVPESNRGFPAYSDDGRMKMVSPERPISVKGIPYDQRLLMAVHEYAHILIGKINPRVPIWLNEGLACLEGSRDFYELILFRYASELRELPFGELRSSYYSIRGADVYSYSAVAFIRDRFGYDALNAILRRPESLLSILSTTEEKFSKDWNAYVRETYGAASKR